MSDHPVASADVLTFWFAEAMAPRWFARDPDLDAEIRRRFAATLTAAADDGLAAWEETAEGRLALIVVLDQFSRNIHRDQPQAFATDPAARAATMRALRRGDDLWLKARRPEPWRAFLYMPLMHSEDLDEQRRCVELFLTHGPEEQARYARAHHDIIARFGRFPHRNACLGRETTDDEAAFLRQEGAGF